MLRVYEAVLRCQRSLPLLGGSWTQPQRMNTTHLNLAGSRAKASSSRPARPSTLPSSCFTTAWQAAGGPLLGANFRASRADGCFAAAFRLPKEHKGPLQASRLDMPVGSCWRACRLWHPNFSSRPGVARVQQAIRTRLR